MSKSVSPTRAGVGSINEEPSGRNNQAVQNLINNNGGWGGSKGSGNGSTRETSPLITSVAMDMPGGEGSRTTRSRIMSRLMQLLGVVILVCAVLFGFFAFHRGQNEAVPFPAVNHPYPPSALWGAAHRPYPTGAWWTNLMLEDGNNNVAVLPYAIKTTVETGIEISYSHWRHLTSALVEADLFAPDVTMSAVENVTERHLETYDPLSVGMMFKTGGKAKSGQPAYFRTSLVRGSPFITVEYNGVTPKITSQYIITTINGLLMQDQNPFFKPRLSGESFDCTIISSQQWLIFANPPITLTWSNQGLVAEEPYYGYIRAAFVPDPSARELLTRYWRSYPTGGRVLLDYNNDAMMTVQWRKKGSDDKLLMLALPHHVELLQKAEIVDVAGPPYQTLKGPMKAVLGDRWFLKEVVPSIRWTAPRKIQDPDKLAAIKKALPDDVHLNVKKTKNEKEATEDPYWAGKEMARLCRLALIAEELGMKEQSDKAVALAEGLLEPWVAGTNQNQFLYDQVWGGIIIKNGMTDPLVNFGNSYYNDHHFQYGYFIYTAAVIAKLDPAFVRKYRPQLDAIAKDVVNYDESSTHFPIARHKDFYDGHSWASGLFVQNNGKSQESSSEAINCYYAASLYGEAVGDKSLQQFAGLLMAMEIRSTKYYWHMRTNDTIYDPEFAASKMVGVVGALDVTCHTWFGTNFEYVHGINFMPFTPITEAYLNRGYVEEEYEVLKTVLTPGPVDEPWKGFVYLDHAIIDPNAAWAEVQTLTAFDSGNSLTNSLYWVATRPDSGPPPPTPAPAQPASSSSSSSSPSSSSSSPVGTASTGTTSHTDPAAKVVVVGGGEEEETGTSGSNRLRQ